ncbi:Glycogen [starch] synthase [Holothuria leucospilota]|uniref:Glycogen [starch] synthase n=1 Tax=Holothuria leucospilota TaxID=206669 RepID=A0A9Q0YJM2_HOLLE|nr:Glycogen [starch] synthase [Holothuria leucospilota]
MASVHRSQRLTRIQKSLPALRLDDIQAFGEMDHGLTAKEENRWVFEVAWEVANKVGGIYTVLRSKAGVTTEELGDQYYMLGPYNETTVRTEVEVGEPEDELIRKAMEKMSLQGIKVVYGRWLIDGSPNVILFDIGTGAKFLENWKNELWDLAHIGIPWHDKESNDATIFGNLCAWFLSDVSIMLIRSKKSDQQNHTI